MHLAHLSTDARTRAVAADWSAASQRASLEELCCAAAISDAKFFSSVAVTGFELGINVSRFTVGMTDESESLKSALARMLMRREPFELSRLTWQPAKWSRRERELLLNWQDQACDNFLEGPGGFSTKVPIYARLKKVLKKTIQNPPALQL